MTLQSLYDTVERQRGSGATHIHIHINIHAYAYGINIHAYAYWSHFFLNLIRTATKRRFSFSLSQQRVVSEEREIEPVHTVMVWSPIMNRQDYQGTTTVECSIMVGMSVLLFLCLTCPCNYCLLIEQHTHRSIVVFVILCILSESNYHFLFRGIICVISQYLRNTVWIVIDCVAAHSPC